MKVVKIFALTVGLGAVISLCWRLTDSPMIYEPIAWIRNTEIAMGSFSIPILLWMIIEELKKMFEEESEE